MDALAGTSDGKFDRSSSAQLSQRNAPGLILPNLISILSHFWTMSWSLHIDVCDGLPAKGKGLPTMDLALPAIDKAGRPSMRHCWPPLMAGSHLVSTDFYFRSFEPAVFH